MVPRMGEEARWLLEPRNPEEAQEYKGCKVLKDFDGVMYSGVVWSVDTSELPYLFKISYEDEDAEDIAWEELQHILHSAPSAKVRREVQQDHKLPKKSKPLPTNGFEDENMAPMTAAPAPRYDGAERSRKRTQLHVDADGRPPLDRPSKKPSRAAPQLYPVASGPSQRDSLQHVHGAEASTSREIGVLRKEGLAGHLEKIRLENFMCHELFEMTFGPHVTLVSGTNGSGKSAIMQGLQACLGVNARSTGRATSLQQFIRTGCNEARIQVTVYNTGIDAFEPARFGPRITFERRLTRSAGSHWKVLNTAGKVVSEHKPADVLKFLGVNAANPLTIITQDMARAFLSGSSDDKKRKYSMFMEGTMLRDSEEELARASSFVDKTHERLNVARQEYVEKKKELQELAGRVQKLQDVETLIEMRKHLEVVHVWTVVWQEEQEADKLRRKLHVVGPERRMQFQQQVDQAAKSLQEVKADEDRLTEEINQANEAANSATADLQRLKDNFTSCRNAKRVLEKQRDQAQSEINELMEQKENFEKVLSEDTTERAQARRQALEHLEQVAAAKRQAVKDADDALTRFRTESSTLRTELEAVRSQLEERKRAAQGCHRQIETYTQQLREHHASKSNKVLRFGSEGVVRLLTAVADNRHKFRREPIGPVGVFLGLRESRWATAIEAAIGRSLDIFLCHTREDVDLLRTLARQANVNMHFFTVVKCNFDVPPHKVSSFRHPGLVSVMDVLSVTDRSKETVIMNWLIDSNGVERTMLTGSAMEARSNMQNGVVPKSYDQSGTLYHRQGRGTNTVINYNGRPPRLGMEDEQILAQLKAALEQAQKDALSVEQQYRELEGQQAELRARSEQIQREQLELGKRKKFAKAELDAHQQELHQQQAELGGSQSQGDEMDDLATQLQRLQGHILETQNGLQDIGSRHQDAVNAENDARALFEQRKELLGRRGDTAAEHTAQMVVLAGRKAKAEAEHREAAQKLADIDGHLAICSNNLQAKEQDLLKLRSIATDINTEENAQLAKVKVEEYFDAKVRGSLEEKKRRKPGTAVANMTDEQLEASVQDTVAGYVRSVEALDKELTSISSRISAAERDAGGDRHQLERSYELLQKAVLKRKRDLDYTVKIANRVEQSLERRNRKADTIRDAIGRNANENFLGFMGRRQHIGHIHLDHDNQELTLEVRVKGITDRSARPVRDLKQLSGGERSYTTVSFLLAIGDFTESPFRCMDEFDVFMDAINRRIATQALLEFASEHLEHQFIFLTPQDIQAVNDAMKHLEARDKAPKLIGDTFLKTVQMRPARN